MLLPLYHYDLLVNSSLGLLTLQWQAYLSILSARLETPGVLFVSLCILLVPGRHLLFSQMSL